ncbi:hypothetical protein D3C76_523510 [compost metagenome]
MGRFAFNMGYKSHAASIFFELGIIQALFSGQFSVSHRTQPFYYKVWRNLRKIFQVKILIIIQARLVLLFYHRGYSSAI